jgi:hypothetical protein
MTSCTSCDNSWCCGEFTEFQGDTVCYPCKEGLQDALGGHFGAAAEHDQFNEGKG